MSGRVHSRPFDVPASLYPFADHWFERDGVALHYVDEGEGVPVVFFHGNPTWSFVYRDVIRGLSGVRALAPDLPGFGMSGHPPDFGYTPQEHVAWLGAWLDSLGVDRFVAVVQDWGGPTGLRTILERSERVAGVVVLNTWAWPPHLMLRTLSWVLGSPLGDWVQARQPDALVRGSMASGASKPDAVFEAYVAPHRDPDHRRGLAVFPRAIRRNDAWLAELEALLPRLRDVPVEMVWGMQDKGLGTEAVIARWLEHLPHANVTRLPHASHFVQEDDPEAVAAAVTRVIERGVLRCAS